MKKIFEQPFYTDYLQLQSILIIQSNWLYKMPDEFIDEFTYEIEADNAKLTFHTIGDEKIGDVILRLENELCQEEVNFFNVMSKSKTKSKSNWKINKETEGMLILKEKRKITEEQVKKRKEKSNIFVKPIDSNDINLLFRPMKQLQHRRMISWRGNKCSQETR